MRGELHALIMSHNTLSFHGSNKGTGPEAGRAVSEKPCGECGPGAQTLRAPRGGRPVPQPRRKDPGARSRYGPFPAQPFNISCPWITISVKSADIRAITAGRMKGMKRFSQRSTDRKSVV